jgi:hypothetical protein
MCHDDTQIIRQRCPLALRNNIFIRTIRSVCPTILLQKAAL